MKKWFLYIGLALFIGAFVGCKKESPTKPTPTFNLFVINETSKEYCIYVNYLYILNAPANRTTAMGSISEGANTRLQAWDGSSMAFEDIVNTNGMEKFDWTLSE